MPYTPIHLHSVYNIHGQSQVAVPLRELQVPTMSSPYYVGPIHVLCTSSKWCLTSKVSMQGLQKGLAPPDHCRQTIGKKGEIFPPAGSACVKTGERGKGKCDLHGAISDCPSWESKIEYFAKQAFILTSSIYRCYHIGLCEYFIHSLFSPLLPPFIC